MTDAERVANQKESIRVLYAEVDVLRSQLDGARAVISAERAKIDHVQSILAETMARRRNLVEARKS